jgi:hypothetical protein
MLELELYTPPDIVTRAVTALGAIDLDPASDLSGRSLIPATAILTREGDGLAHPWPGRVWLYPPQGRQTAAWVAKLLHEYRSKRTTAAIFYAPVDARAPWWQHLAVEATICFPPGAHRAVCEDGSSLPRSRMSSVLAYLGPEPDRFTAAMSDLGVVLQRSV